MSVCCFASSPSTVAVSIVVSVIVSLTLTPMMCARVADAREQKQTGPRLSRALEGFFDGLVEAYDRALVVALRHRVVTLMVMILTVVATVALFVANPERLLPAAGHRADPRHRRGRRRTFRPQAMKDRSRRSSTS